MKEHNRVSSLMSRTSGKTIPWSICFIALSLLVLQECSSAPKEKPIYSYELPWSGQVLHADSIMTMTPETRYDGTERLLAYLSAREMAEASLLDQIRKLPLTNTETIGNALDRKPAVLNRVKTFIRHARVEKVGYVPGKGVQVVESAYLGADFQSLLGVTLHLMPEKKKKVLGPDTSKPGGGAGSGGGGMPMMPMMP